MNVDKTCSCNAGWHSWCWLFWCQFVWLYEINNTSLYLYYKLISTLFQQISFTYLWTTVLEQSVRAFTIAFESCCILILVVTVVVKTVPLVKGRQQMWISPVFENDIKRISRDAVGVTCIWSIVDRLRTSFN